MENRIFFSWQSDTETRTGRNFIVDVLERACAAVSSGADLEEAVRELQVDSDTKGVAGRAPIVDTIFKKIDASKVYVADVTFVAKRIDGRPSPNPNVLIEYGWALKSKGYEKVITLMNTAYGEPSDETLPFNMKHILHPVTYHLEEGASAEEKASQRDILKKIMQKEIASCLGTIVETISEPPLFVPKVTDLGTARFCPPEESIGFDDGFSFSDEKEIFLQNDVEMWLRVMPVEKQDKKWTIPELKATREKDVGNLAPLIGRGGYSSLRAEDGVGTYISSGEKGSTAIALGVSFAFETGEVWGIDTALLSYASDQLYQSEIEKNYSSALNNYTKFLSILGVKGSFRWIAGINGTKGRHLGYPPPEGKAWVNSKGPTCAAKQIIAEGTYDGVTTSSESLLPFFKKIFEKCGRERPDYLSQK
ncbi:MAG: hypothetical protein PHF79_02685 [Candidatus Pacebacteria bacterium]|nr:hypothetical protein [Candidatus Paceibacterota bacterium]